MDGRIWSVKGPGGLEPFGKALYCLQQGRHFAAPEFFILAFVGDCALPASEV